MTGSIPLDEDAALRKAFRFYYERDMPGEEVLWEPHTEQPLEAWISDLNDLLPRTHAEFEALGVDTGLLRRARAILRSRGFE